MYALDRAGARLYSDCKIIKLLLKLTSSDIFKPLRGEKRKDDKTDDQASKCNFGGI